jgi:ubiquinone/menaquinone biosynthesis C-methylase UbiE
MNKEYFNSRFKFSSKGDDIWKVVCNYLQKEIDQKAKVLDLGAGYCSFINNISAGEKHTLDVCRDFSSYANEEVATHIQTETDLSKFSSGYFDVVFASNFFEHLHSSDFTKALAEARRVLKTGGKLIIIQPNFKYCWREYFDDYTHFQVFTHLSLRDILIGNKFSIDKMIRDLFRFPYIQIYIRFQLWLNSIYYCLLSHLHLKC